jgi:predicted branched-subunit amino acid permease
MPSIAFYRDPAWRRELLRGAHAALPAAAGVVAWGLVMGVTMIKSGISVPWAIAISLLAYAGSAQLAALPLIAVGQPF